MKLVKHNASCHRALGTRQSLAARPAAVPGNRHRRALHVCQTAASDEKSRAGPLFLSDLIAFETDVDADGNPSPASSGSMSGTSRDANSSSSGSSLASSLGLGSSGIAGEDDHTHKAQEIINRATEVLAAARAALSTPAAEQGTSSGAPQQASSSSSSSTPTAASQQQPTTKPSSGAAGPPSSSSAAGPGPSSSSSSSGGGPASDGGAAGSSEPLTRRWSQLSDGQDLTRHVLQSALDQMQSSGAPIAAPKDPPAPPSSSSSRGGSSSSSGGTAMPTSSFQTKGPSGPPVMGAAAGAAAAAGGGVRLPRDIRSSGRAPADTGHSPAPSWAQSLLGSDDFGGSPGGGSLFPSELQLQRAPAAAAGPAALPFADEPMTLTLPPVALGLKSQSQLDAERAKAAVLPPLQSVLELTTAFRPPERTGAAPQADVMVDAITGEEVAAPAPVGRALADGSGRLADGTWWEKKSGIEYGKNGYWKRWQLLRGGSADGTVEWEETWWDASDYTGLKEMGAQKQGKNADGDAWRESWTERLMYASNDLDCVVERNAHKWAAQGNGDEWEEKWGEHYHASGKVAKFADKWGKTGPNVWHERWGEDYDSSVGDACVKWTDKWAERLLPDGAREQWGDKWHEAFANGRGEKNGEVWSVGAGGDRYQRWWGEQHLGDMRVRRHGHSTTGEYWDDIAHMDTYYNPVPHFGFKLALDHSPQLRGVPLKPKEVKADDPFGPGLDAL
uniref:Uncharacterized protein n=1 Tax=Tetradesmus obliquus TaxID=3088 RepID=A0A383VYZ1_TETOB|eukprot:jgi/Sobl393_1/10529/SZX70073.1